MKKELNIALNTNYEESKRLNILSMISGDKLKKIMSSSEDLCVEIKKNKERSTMLRFDAIVHSYKFQNHLAKKYKD